MKGDTYTCRVCGKKTVLCPRCQIRLPNYNYENFCSQEHSDVFAILSKNGCGLATNEETLDALKDYDLSNVTEPIKAHIAAITPVKVESKRNRIVPVDDQE